MNKSKPGSTNSPEGWGGRWTEQKLDAFMSYVKAYLTIMEKYPYWKTIYFDGFAGAGESIVKKNGRYDLFEGEIPDGIDVYKGSVARILEERDKQFNYYYFIETDPSNVARIEELKKRNTHIGPNRISIRQSDCNKELLSLAKALKEQKLATLMFIDPFGMQVDWDVLKQFKETRSDIWILIPSGVAINRLLPVSGKVTSTKLESFFGLTNAEIKDFFYYLEETPDLFGGHERLNKHPKPIQRVAELYIQQLKTVWKYVSEQPLVLKNSTNSTIFHLIFASNKQSAVKIASQIIAKKQK